MSIRNIDDVARLEATPLQDRNLPDSTYDVLKGAALVNADKTALSFFTNAAALDDTHNWNFSELLFEINKAANAIQSLGLGSDDVVAYMLPNLPETHFVLWGAEANGIAFAINPQLDESTIAALLESAQAKALVTLGPTPGADLWEKATSAILKNTSIKHLITISMSRYLSTHKKLALKLHSLVHNRQSLVDANGQKVQVTPYHSLARQVRGDTLVSSRRITPDDISSYFCTGGTTGRPKIAVRNHRNEVFNAFAMTLTLENGAGPGKSFFCGLPLFHVNAQLITGLMPWSKGARVVLATPQGYRGEGVIPRFWSLVEHFRINFFSGVPAIYSGLLQQPIDGHDISSLELGMCGAAPMPVELFRRFQEATGIRILEGYGLTEGTCASSSNPPEGESRIGSIGLRIPYQQMKIVQLDGHQWQRDCDFDEVGVVTIAGPNVFQGYLSEEHNKALWLDCGDGQRWLNTGDLGRCDPDGYFWLTGRKKELIIRGGHNIDPKIIEEAIACHPDVLMAAAVGRPDAYAGEVPVVYVSAKPDSDLDEAQLLKYCTANIPERAAVPKRIYIVDDLPMTAIGKIFKPDLTRQQIESVVRECAVDTGDKLTGLTIEQHPTRGWLATIEISTSSPTLCEALGHFTFATDFTTQYSGASRND
jgi:fatty-acyl-CoA synthase